jgi:predicted extracellular nuclease
MPQRHSTTAPIVTIFFVVLLFITGNAQNGSKNNGENDSLISSSVVISQFYGGGGSAGSTYINDFVEIFNRGTTAVDLTGWSVQYRGKFEGTWKITTLNGLVLLPGQYYLVQQAGDGGGNMALPSPDTIGTVAMDPADGVVLLANITDPIFAICTTGGNVIDLIGYGQWGGCEETAKTGSPGDTMALLRGANGCVETDVNSRDFFIAAPAPRNTSSAFNSCGVTNAPIHDIQGSGSTSPQIGRLVTTTGIVTGYRNGYGFFIQSPDVDADADPDTSEGIFVSYTSGFPAKGSLVSVAGSLNEFIPWGRLKMPPFTRIDSVSAVNVLSTGNPLPQPVTITAADMTANDIENLERLEGMRISVPSLSVIEATSGGFTSYIAPVSSMGIFYGVIPGTQRPFREPGVGLTIDLLSGSPPNVPRYDTNPEILRVNSRGQYGVFPVDASYGATVSGLTGVLEYDTAYTLLPDLGAPAVSNNTLTATALPAPVPSQITVATLDIDRFYNDMNDPALGEPVLTTASFNLRLNKLSLAVRLLMRSPDVIAVEEVEDLATLQALAAKLNADTIAGGSSDPGYQAYLIDMSQVTNLDVGFLVKSSRVSVVDSAQIGASATYSSPTTIPSPLFRAPPFMLRVTAPGGFPITLIVHHSMPFLSSDSEGGEAFRYQRRAQAEFLASAIQSRISANPIEKIVLLGNFEAPQFNDGYVDMLGTVRGSPTEADQVLLPSADLLNPNMINLTDSLPAAERYTFSNGGSAEARDHILVTPNLSTSVTRFAIARIGVDYPEILRDDANRAERATSHDAPVLYISTAAPTAANVSVSGRVLTASGLAIQGASVQITNQRGDTITAIVNPFGFYRFDNVATGEVYTISASAKRYRFTPQVISVGDEIPGVDLIPQQ